MDGNNYYGVSIAGDVTNSAVIAGHSVQVDQQVTLHSSVSENDDLCSAETLTFPDASQLEVLAALRSKFVMEDIELISWELGIRFDDLSGATLTAKALDLVRRAASLGLLDKLTAIVQHERPDMPTAA
jgi:hypothetical protein